MCKQDVIALAELACREGATFDVVYEVSGDVRVNVYPKEPGAKPSEPSFIGTVRRTLRDPTWMGYCARWGIDPDRPYRNKT